MIVTSAGNNLGLNKKDTNRIQYCTRVSHLYHNESGNEGPPCRDAGWTSLPMCCYDSGAMMCKISKVTESKP